MRTETKPQGLEGSAPIDWNHPYRNLTPNTGLDWNKCDVKVRRRNRKKAAVAATPCFQAEGWDDWRRLFGTVKQSLMFQE